MTTISSRLRSYFNTGQFETSGIDLQLDWGMDADPGRIGVTTLLNYLLTMYSTEIAGANPMVDYVGTYGPSGNGLDGNSFEWRALITVTYFMPSWDATIRWQHLDGLNEVSTSSVLTPLASCEMFDLLGNYRLNDSLSFRFGIENLLYTA